jgi:ubiquinone/menaquinone biosynthesis C-methylase UbiE
VDLAELKERTRRVWGMGDYSGLSAILEPAAHELVDACAISAGQEVLDVGAGDGNLAIAAAAEGARVVASDISPVMVESGRGRSEREGFDIEWVEADAEELPFEDGRFDCAASVFGAFIAPRPEVVASELFRVVRPGGTVGMANWGPESFPGRMFDVAAEYLPRPPGLPKPVEWGVEETARARLAPHAASVEIERRVLRWEDESPAAFLDRLEASAPTQVAAKENLAPADHRAMSEGIIRLAEEFNRSTDGSLAIDAEYVLVVARKRG